VHEDRGTQPFGQLGEERLETRIRRMTTPSTFVPISTPLKQPVAIKLSSSRAPSSDPAGALLECAEARRACATILTVTS